MVHSRLYCLCFELLLPEPSPLKRLGFFMSKIKRNIPTKNQIKNYWKCRIVDIKHNIFPSVEYLCKGDYCFACGMLTNNHTERAHILARQEGGSDNVDNLHLLCPACHKDSEMISGDLYYEWLVKRTHVDAILSISYKVDYSFYRSFRETAQELKIDIDSIEFLNRLNHARKFSFDADNYLEKLEARDVKKIIKSNPGGCNEQTHHEAV